MPEKTDDALIKKALIHAGGLSFFIAFLLNLLSGFLWISLDQRRETNFQKSLQTEAEYLIRQMDDDLKNRFPYMRSMARRWESRGGLTKEEFLSDAQGYLSDFLGAYSLNWVDKEGIVRWIMPVEGNEKTLNLDFSREKNLTNILGKTKISFLPVMSPPMDLIQGGKGFYIFFPIQIRGEFQGFVLAVFRFQEWVSYVITSDEHHNQLHDFRTLIFMDGQLIFKQPGWDDSCSKDRIFFAENKILNHVFTLHLQPTREFVESNKSILPKLAGLSGMLLSILIALIIYLLQKSRIESWYMRKAKKILETEIQERMKTEDELQQALSQIDMATKAGGIGIWSLDLETEILTLNETICRLFNYPPDYRATYKIWHDIIHPEDVEATESLLKKAVLGKAVYKTEYRVIMPDTGNLYYLGVAGRVERDSSGRALRMNGISWDLTSLKKTEEILRKSESQVRLLLNSTAEAIYGIDLHGDCTFANPACLRMLRYSDISQVIGKNMHDLIHHSYSDGRRMPVEVCRIYKAFRVGRGEHVDDEVLWRADGTFFPVEYWSFPQIENGEIVGAVVTFLDITERRRAEESLASSQKKYRELVETLHDWVWEVDLQGNYTYVGPQVKTILGYEPEEVLGKTPFDLMPPPEKDRVFKLFTPLIMEGKPVLALENMNMHKDGHEVLLETNGYPFFDSKGNLKGYRGADRDITKRKQMETELKQSEEKFAKAFQTSPYVIVLSRLEDGNLIEVNEAFLWFTGYTREEALGKNSIDLKLWHNSEDREEVMRIIREGRPLFNREYAFRKKDGEIAIGLFSAQRLELSQGPCLLSSINNITERKHLEEALRQNRRFLSEIIEHSGTMICFKDREGVYELVNKKWEEITGIKREKAFGRTDEELFPGGVAARFRETDLEVMKTGSVFETEEVLEDAHGKRFFISIKFPIKNDNNEINGICAMITEITERKYAEKLLSLERQRLSFIIEGTQLGTWEWNIQTGMNRVNERWAGIIGYTLEEISPVTLDTWKKFVHPEDLKASLALIEKNLRKELDYYECEMRILHKNGTWVWVLDRGKVSMWDNEGNPLIMSGTHQDITERKNSEEKIRHMATHDVLTDLPGLRLARDRLFMAMNTAVRYNTGVSLMFIDFDGFKRVNDSFGHDAGDELLKEAARRFSACVRKTDTVARIGGDEFLIVVTEMKIPENASKVAEKLIESFSKPFRINSSHQILMTVSIGISFYPRDSDNLEGLIKLADEAMYEVKKNGKNGYVFSKTVLDQKSG